MKKRATIFIGVIAINLLAAMTVLGGLHFIGSSSVDSGSVIAKVDVGGFGNDTEDITVDLHISGTGLQAMCENNGGKVAWGQELFDATANASQTVTVNKNGKATANFKTEIAPDAKAAGCPNGNWTVVGVIGIINVDFLAMNNSTGETAELKNICDVNEPQAFIACDEV